MRKERSHAFDALCGLCIVRMMMLHITNMCGFNDEAWWQIVMDWTYFFIPFFFFKAGYFNKSVVGDTVDFVRGKAKRLLLPYVVWGLIGNAVYFFFSYVVFSERHYTRKSLSLSHLWEDGGFYGNPPCWFLLSFFMTYVVVHLLHKSKLSFVSFLFPVLGYVLYRHDISFPFGLENVFLGVFFFFLGKMWRSVVLCLPSRATMLLSSILIVAFVATTLIGSGQYVMSRNEWIGNPLLMMLSSVFAVCGLSGLLQNILARPLPVVGYMGRHSMVYFVVHYPLLFLYSFIRSASVHTVREQWDDYVLMTIFTFCISTWLVPYVERVPWMSGRYRT